MRITIVQGAFLPVPPLLGGAVEKVWFHLGKEFARRGHSVVHVSRAYPPLPRAETIDGVRHERVAGFASPAGTPLRLLRDLRYALRVQRRLPEADILVTNTFWLPVVARRRSRGRVYVHVARYPKGQMKLYRDAILQTVSDPIRVAILREEPAAAARTRVIPYPLADHYLRPSLPAGERIVLYAGRVHPEKGVHLLIEAFARLPASYRDVWRLQIVGPWQIERGGGGEPYLQRLRAAAAPVSDRVEFVGGVFDEARLVEHYASARVFVYPSLAERGETFGLAALEAMAAGGCPVVSDLACFRDFIRPGENGLVFDHRAPDPAGQLSAALAGLLPDADATNTLRAAAWRTARQYTIDSIATRFLDDFAALVVARGAPGPTAAASRHA